MDSILDENIYDARIRPSSLNSSDGPTQIQGVLIRLMMSRWSSAFRSGLMIDYNLVINWALQWEVGQYNHQCLSSSN